MTGQELSDFYYAQHIKLKNASQSLHESAKRMLSVSNSMKRLVQQGNKDDNSTKPTASKNHP